MEHVFIEIGQRRWCMCCDLFQQRRRDTPFSASRNCKNDVPAASENRLILSEAVKSREGEL